MADAIPWRHTVENSTVENRKSLFLYAEYAELRQEVASDAIGDEEDDQDRRRWLGKGASMVGF